MELDFNLVTNIDLLSGSPCAELPGVCLERAEYITTLALPRVTKPTRWCTNGVVGIRKSSTFRMR